MRDDLGTYPTYLYDENPFNDVFYMFNKDVIFGRVYAMVSDNGATGITSFDDYSRWQDLYTFGVNSVIPDGVTNERPSDEVHLSDEERQTIYGNITQNVTSLADEYPDVEFYYYFSPYSAVWWAEHINEGICKWIEAEQYAIELILEHPNIKLYSFNNRTDITTDLNNYKDISHYGEWVNSYILKAMYEGEFLLTKDNYQEYIQREMEFYTTYDYSKLNEQEDYEQDYYAAALLDQEINGTEPIKILELSSEEIQLCDAEISNGEKKETLKLSCKGALSGDRDHSVVPYAYLMDEEYIGAKVSIDNIDPYEYLIFYGQKENDNGQPIVIIYGDEGTVLKEFSLSYEDIDNEKHQYLIDVSDLTGNVTILFNGGYIDGCGSEESEYIFEDIELY